MPAECPFNEWVAFDLETTGLMAETDRVVEIGAVRFDSFGSESGRFERLVNPERPMSAAAFEIHGIGDSDLAAAPPAARVLPEFLEFLGDPARVGLLAHNASFDAGFLGRELTRLGIPLPGHTIIDTLALARRRLPDLFDHRLDSLARLFNLERSGPHRALTDSLRVKGLWMALQAGPDEGPEKPPVSYPIYDPKRKPVPNGWEGLSEAIARGQRVRMVYTGGSRGEALREITPRGFAHRGGIAYLVAFCHLDAFEKSFRLDRVERFEVVP